MFGFGFGLGQARALLSGSTPKVCRELVRRSRVGQGGGAYGEPIRPRGGVVLVAQLLLPSFALPLSLRRSAGLSFPIPTW